MSVVAEHSQVTFFIRQQTSIVFPGQNRIEPTGHRTREEAKRPEKSPAFEQSFPGSTSAKEVTMDEADAKPIGDEVVRLLKNVGSEKGFIGVYKPQVMITGQD
jgi:hypothetical protein